MYQLARPYFLMFLTLFHHPSQSHPFSKTQGYLFLVSYCDLWLRYISKHSTLCLTHTHYALIDQLNRILQIIYLLHTWIYPTFFFPYIPVLFEPLIASKLSYSKSSHKYIFTSKYLLIAYYMSYPLRSAFTQIISLIFCMVGINISKVKKKQNKIKCDKSSLSTLHCLCIHESTEQYFILYLQSQSLSFVKHILKQYYG